MSRNDTSGFAIAAFIVGIINFCAWLLPLCGLPLALIGIIFAAISWNSTQRNLAIAGFVLSCLGLIAGIINAGLGIVLALGVH